MTQTNKFSAVWLLIKNEKRLENQLKHKTLCWTWRTFFISCVGSDRTPWFSGCFWLNSCKFSSILSSKWSHRPIGKYNNKFPTKLRKKTCTKTAGQRVQKAEKWVQNMFFSKLSSAQHSSQFYSRCRASWKTLFWIFSDSRPRERVLSCCRSIYTFFCFASPRMWKKIVFQVRQPELSSTYMC